MAASSSSSDYAANSTNGKYLPNDGTSEVTRAGVQRRTVHEERSSFMEQLNNSQDGECKGKAIISGAGHFDQLTGGNIVTPEILEAESSHMADINNLEIRKGNHPSLSDTQGAEMDLQIRLGIRSNVTDTKVVTPEILEAESFHMAGMDNLQIRKENQPSMSDTQGEEMDLQIVGETETEEIDGETGTEEIDEEPESDILCGCCYYEFQLEDTVQCPNGHLFCFGCIRKRVEKILYGSFKAHASLSCMDIDDCTESIPLSEIRRAIPNDVIERYEDRKAQDAIVEAKLEGLVYCPFCNIPYEVDRCLQVLDCPNTKCLQASCIQCKKLNHLPLLCEEVQKMPDTLRGEVEERMTKAVTRECNICHARLIKMGGCNQVRCRCGNIMCYVCEQTLSCSYGHFCDCFDRRAEPGKRCQICNRCSSMGDVPEDNEALDAKEEALKELADKEPKLIDLEIGPPLKRLRQQPPTMEERPDLQYQHVQAFQAYQNRFGFMVNHPRDGEDVQQLTPTPFFEDDEHQALQAFQAYQNRFGFMVDHPRDGEDVQPLTPTPFFGDDEHQALQAFQAYQNRFGFMVDHPRDGEDVQPLTPTPFFGDDEHQALQAFQAYQNRFGFMVDHPRDGEDVQPLTPTPFFGDDEHQALQAFQAYQNRFGFMVDHPRDGEDVQPLTPTPFFGDDEHQALQAFQAYQNRFGFMVDHPRDGEDVQPLTPTPFFGDDEHQALQAFQAYQNRFGFMVDHPRDGEDVQPLTPTPFFGDDEHQALQAFQAYQNRFGFMVDHPRDGEDVQPLTPTPFFGDDEHQALQAFQAYQNRFGFMVDHPRDGEDVQPQTPTPFFGDDEHQALQPFQAYQNRFGFMVDHPRDGEDVQPQTPTPFFGDDEHQALQAFQAYQNRFGFMVDHPRDGEDVQPLTPTPFYEYDDHKALQAFQAYQNRFGHMVDVQRETPTRFFEDDEHHANMDGPETPTGFVGDGEQYADIVEPPPLLFRHDEQLASMELQAEEDHIGPQEHQPEDK